MDTLCLIVNSTQNAHIERHRIAHRTPQPQALLQAKSHIRRYVDDIFHDTKVPGMYHIRTAYPFRELLLESCQGSRVISVC